MHHNTLLNACWTSSSSSSCKPMWTILSQKLLKTLSSLSPSAAPPKEGNKSYYSSSFLHEQDFFQSNSVGNSTAITAADRNTITQMDQNPKGPKTSTRKLCKWTPTQVIPKKLLHPESPVLHILTAKLQDKGSHFLCTQNCQFLHILTAKLLNKTRLYFCCSCCGFDLFL